MATPAEIDEAILSVVGERWQKVLMVIARTLGPRPWEALDSDYEQVGARIQILIEQGKLQCQGNPKRWRHSEVRLPREGPERLYYVATVAIIFPSLEPEGSEEFDLYEMDILFESDSPQQALKDAIDISKRSPTWIRLEYPEPAVLHAVRRIQHEYPQYTIPSWHRPQEWFHFGVAKIDRKTLDALRRGDDVQLWYGFVHVDG